ncbi:PAS domain S-box protein [Rufibacter sp. H-1]|uniref:histidine kinase n=1 Tax=Rufibacter sediminis TaxID=2762756 RepID=A0ABR6VX68_9BACT|nr:PAS domain S-box protein [Rufibacter sediminis]MBC3541780.1 PAS domain S-box protein [Rufibacter sediminis]
MHIQRTLFGVFLIAFLSLVLFTVIAYFNLQENAALDRQEKVSLQVLKSIEVLFNNLEDMEEGAASASSFHRQTSLSQYNAARELYPKHLQALLRAQVTDSAERYQIKTLSGLTESFVKTAAMVVSGTGSFPSPDLAREQLQDQLASIKLLVHAIEEKERATLYANGAESSVRSERMLTIFTAFSVFMFLFFMTTYLFISRNLSNRSRAAKVLKEKEQLFSGLFYKSPIMLTLVEVSTEKIMDINENALLFFGQTREHVIGKSVREMDIILDPAFREIMFERLQHDQKVQNLETQIKARNGRIRNVVYHMEQVFLNNEKCLIMAFEDITDRKMAEKRLKESETLFSQIFYKSPIMKCISEVDTGVYLDVNDNYTRFFGYEKEELIGKASTELNFWKNPSDRSILIKELREKGEFRSLEFELKTKSGELRHILLHADLVQLDGGECLMTAFVDITESKQAGDFLKNMNLSLEKSVAERIKEISDYKYALDQAALVAITDTNGRYIHANENFCLLTEYQPEELLGQHYSIIASDYHPAQEFFENHNLTASGGTIWESEIKSKTKSGKFFWADTTIIPILDASGVAYQYLIIRWDITAKKNTETALLQAFEELGKSENRLKQAQALSHLGSWEYAFDTQQTIWSDELYAILGTSPAETEADFSSFLGFVHPEDVAMVEETVISTLNSENVSCQYNCRIIRKDGEVRYIFLVFEREPTVPGQPDKLLGILQDVTKERLAQMEKERITADLLQRNKDLEQFAYIVSHNLRAPAANIIGLSDLICTLKPSTPAFMKSINGLKISVAKLDAVINDLNNVLQIRREVNERKEQVDLYQLVEDIKTMTSGLMAKEKVSIQTNFSDLEKIYTIKSYLHSIFANLISNSIKYRQANQVPAIEILSNKKDGKNIITFRDNGLGIDLTAHQHKIFGLYKRFHFHTDGKGMGLYMVKTQVEALGGKIHVHSRVNHGTEFSIEFDEAYT